jgi:ABC-type antimicrobial peptide transport system permease subunit
MAPKNTNRLDALQVRTARDRAGVTRAIQEEVRRINPRLFLDIRTVRREMDRSLSKERMLAATSGFFSALGLVLASIGIFGVASYTVAQRTAELGIRMALGAGRWSVIRESLRETMLVVAAGLTCGFVAAVIAVRITASFISDLLFGLTANDSLNIIAAVLLMVAIAMAACILPARHATKIDPLTAIRYE